MKNKGNIRYNYEEKKIHSVLLSYIYGIFRIYEDNSRELIKHADCFESSMKQSLHFSFFYILCNYAVKKAWIKSNLNLYFINNDIKDYK